ncbi:MFS transporter [Marivivens niveibacter]|uniref:MFS transporter n=1 Tax=Marivivens niveibacter TaxID=1930667 RepID=A0A251WWI4_9RHOB|nr:MFS transporter [Marivivens niveibacter]OUD08787.1 MFS transporter [Marivivens niveibacter]
MIQVLGSSWALLIGVFMLMIGNGLQGTLLGLRGELEGFSTLSMSIVMSAYFVGFLFASRAVPELIRRVGHVRVFAALGSTISAILILYPALTEPWAWTLGRLCIGFCFCGVYVTAESWLNDSTDNANRGKALSLYMITQMAGIVLAQYIVVLGDVSGFVLFIIPSVLVSMSFAPILLSIRPTPAFETTKPLSIKRLIEVSPLACMGMFLLGGIFAAQFGMSAVFGIRAGLTVPQISFMVSAIYTAALLAQFPIGWLSDRMDRRRLILGLAVLGGIGALIPTFVTTFPAFVLGAALIGAASNPLYALLLAYANDYLDREDMAAASGGFLFINGVGAISGPLIVGFSMDTVGPQGYWGYMAILMISMALYALYRMTQRSTDTPVQDTVAYAPILASATPVALEVAQEVYIEAEENAQEGDE